MVREFAYSRKKRITSTDEFSVVLRTKPVAKAGCFALHIGTEARSESRLGLVIGKRFVKHAVNRNQLKRLVREYFRLTRLTSLDYIVRVSKIVDKPLTVEFKQAARADLTKLFGAYRLE